DLSEQTDFEADHPGVSFEYKSHLRAARRAHSAATRSPPANRRRQKYQGNRRSPWREHQDCRSPSIAFDATARDSRSAGTRPFRDSDRSGFSRNVTVAEVRFSLTGGALGLHATCCAKKATDVFYVTR